MILGSRKNLIVLALLGVICAGCCRHSLPWVSSSANYAIFNPGTSPTMVADNSRADWPSAYTGDVVSEEIAYHEQILDIQGRGWNHDDGYLYRRFRSDRYGRGRR